MQSVTSNAVAVANSYSTSEVFTGKYWIDGKKIYRIAFKTVIADIGINGDHELTRILTNKNIDSIIDMHGTITFTENGRIVSFPNAYEFLTINSSNMIVYIRNIWSSNTTIILFYLLQNTPKQQIKILYIH